MKRTRANLRAGLWPDARPGTDAVDALAPAARKQADAVIAALEYGGLKVDLHQDRLRVTGKNIPSRDIRMLVEKFGDQVEWRLRERTIGEGDEA